MPKNKSQRRLSSITVAADHYDVSTRTIRRWVARGLITGYRVGPRLIKVDLDEVEGLLTPIGGGV